jgi:hypothetical protein
MLAPSPAAAPPPSASFFFASESSRSRRRRSSIRGRRARGDFADRRLEFACHRPGDVAQRVRVVARGVAGQRLDAAHAGADRRLLDDRDGADVAGAAHVGAAA